MKLSKKWCPIFDEKLLAKSKSFGKKKMSQKKKIHSRIFFLKE